MASLPPDLKITVDATKIHLEKCMTDPKKLESTIFCSCKTELCTCGSNLSVTEATAKKTYSHFGYPSGRDDMLLEGCRLDTLHIWGTQDLSTKELLNWLAEFNPKEIEWIDDFSCDVKLPGAERRSDYYKRFGNPNYGGIVGLLSHSYRRRTKNARLKDGRCDVWTGDLRHVNSPHGDSSSSQTEGKFDDLGVSERGTRQLVTYKDLYDDDYIDDGDDLNELVKNFDIGLISVQKSLSSSTSQNRNFLSKNRRRGADVSESSPSVPRKWPREDSFPLQVRPTGDVPILHTAPELRFGKSRELSNSKSRSVVTASNRVSAKQRLGSRTPLATLATVTLLPDTDGDSEHLSVRGPQRLLTSLSMVADLEEQNLSCQKKSDCHTSSPMAEGNPFTVPKRRNQLPCNNRNVWNRLG